MNIGLINMDSVEKIVDGLDYVDQGTDYNSTAPHVRLVEKGYDALSSIDRIIYEHGLELEPQNKRQEMLIEETRLGMRDVYKNSMDMTKSMILNNSIHMINDSVDNHKKEIKDKVFDLDIPELDSENPKNNNEIISDFPKGIDEYSNIINGLNTEQAVYKVEGTFERKDNKKYKF